MKYDNELIYNDWVEYQRSKIRNWRKKKSNKLFIGARPYLHFDGTVSFKHNIDTGDHTINNVLKSSDLIAAHAFLPFIRKDQRVRRYRNKALYDSDGRKRVHTERYPTIKNRPIMYASHRDACIYSMYGSILEKSLENSLLVNNLTDNVIAYRSIPRDDRSGRNKSNVDFSKEVHDFILSSDNVVVMMLDVSHFFDKIDHMLLEKAWLREIQEMTMPLDHRAVFKSLTNHRYVFYADLIKLLGLDKEKIERIVKSRKALCSPKDFNKYIKKTNAIRQNKSTYGIPQGSPISGLLANIYLKDFDLRLSQIINAEHGLYRRYSDDILIVVDQNKAHYIHDMTMDLLRDFKLSIQNKKTEIFAYNGSERKYSNISKDFNGGIQNNKEVPQYLGLSLSPKGMIIRSATIVKRFRGNNRLQADRWKYFKLAYSKTKSLPMMGQTSRVRRKIKQNIQNPITGTNKKRKVKK